MLRNILSMTVFRWIHSDKRLHIRFVLSYISVSPLRQTPHILGYYLLRIFWYILRMSWKSSLFLLLLLSLTELRRNLRHQQPDNLNKRDWICHKSFYIWVADWRWWWPFTVSIVIRHYFGITHLDLKRNYNPQLGPIAIKHEKDFDWQQPLSAVND